MISYLKGKAKLFRWGMIILDVHGVGYKVVINPQINIKNNIVDIEEDIELYIHEHIREDADDLYGFLSFEELELFEKLISVSGVGPKAGLAIMSSSTPDKIKTAIAKDDASFFTSISGIGKKVAAKIILDLRTKMGSRSEFSLDNLEQSNDVLDALLSLGYLKQELQRIINQIPVELKSSEEKVRWCLKNLGK